MKSAANLPSDLSSSHQVINQLTLKNIELTDKNTELESQVAWFKRQLFGSKSERLVAASGELEQMWLGGKAPEQSEPAAATTTIKEHVRKKYGKQAIEDDCGESGLRYDSTVEVQVVDCQPDEIKELSPQDYEVIDTKVSERLCQRSQYFVRRYVRPVVKIKQSGQLVTKPAPGAVFDRSYADVSLLAGILTDKFQYHLPLFRQHERMLKGGITIARGNLTAWVHRAAMLLSPISNAVLASVLGSEVLAIDETPIKVGLNKNKDKKSAMHQGYMWVLYGDKDEVFFLYSETRGREAIEKSLKDFKGTTLTDGYAVYGSLAEKYQDKIEHALCWAHTRREFFEAKDNEPELCNRALEYIRKIYEAEEQIRVLKLEDEKKRAYRLLHSKPLVEELFEWLKGHQLEGALLPSNKFTKAAGYALNIESGLKVFLEDPAVQVDTNHLERALRPIPMGRKNWLFCWTEVGAQAVAVVQTLIASCKLHNVNAFEYLVDVLQKIDSVSQQQVHTLTPRNWAAQKAKEKAKNMGNNGAE